MSCPKPTRLHGTATKACLPQPYTRSQKLCIPAYTSLSFPFLCSPLLLWLTVDCREAFTKSERSDSFTSPAGQTTASPTTPLACWDLSGRSNPRAHPMQAHWWYTAGKESSPVLPHGCKVNWFWVWGFMEILETSSIL